MTEANPAPAAARYPEHYQPWWQIGELRLSSLRRLLSRRCRAERPRNRTEQKTWRTMQHEEGSFQISQTHDPRVGRQDSRRRTEARSGEVGSGRLPNCMIGVTTRPRRTA